MEHYRNYSDFLKQKYGEKVYKIPISLPVTCPNRDGTLSKAPCIFCGSIGADYETKAVGMKITRQLDRSIAHVGPKYKAKKFIAYFLNFTNTYALPDDFGRWMEEAMQHPDVVGVDVSTRPDCIHERYLDILKELSDTYGKDVTIELGLQSSNAHTLEKIGRCHGVAEYIDASLRIARYGFGQCTHVIADLPWDDRIDVIETAKLISVLPVTEVKLHSLYIVKDTRSRICMKPARSRSLRWRNTWSASFSSFPISAPTSSSSVSSVAPRAGIPSLSMAAPRGGTSRKGSTP